MGVPVLDKLTHRKLSFLVNDMFIVYIYNVKHAFPIFTAVLIGFRVEFGMIIHFGKTM